MKVITSNIEQFSTFFKVVYDVASEIVELQFYTDHLTCTFLDKSRTRFFYVNYESMFFDEYDVEERVSECVSIEDMFNLFKLANKSDTLTLSFDDEHMYAELESKTGNKRLFEFVLPYDFVDSPQLPNISLPSHFDLATADIKQSVKDIGLLGTDIFQFVVADGSVTLMMDTMSDTGSYSSTKYAQVIETETNSEEQLTVRFSLNYIEQMVKFEKISKTVSIDLGEMAMMYKFEDSIMGVTVQGMVAPRVIEEE